MMAGMTTDNNRTFVPNIDISPFLHDPQSSAASKVTEAVRQACLKTGFFQITGHGMPKELQNGLFEAAQNFFALPMEQKAKLDARDQLGRRGYDMLEAETFESGVLPDLKEARRFFMGPNVWPEETAVALKDFREPVQKYFSAINSLAVKILDLLASTLPYGPRVFSDFTDGYVVAPLRLLHYPPARALKPGAKQQGAGAHTDFGAITLLLQDENPGLEVLDTERNEFIPIEPTPSAFVVNIGDMLSAWTGGKYKSSVHRVVNRRAADRYSAAFFYDGNLDCALDPLDGSKPDVEDWTVEKHMIKRITDSYKNTG
ncbi:MAG: hypothetical protein M1828_001131 [Chrysothrix sp. TS-e1954]|nr:MAG: hypothetical protein M1828_001131 [Chrysothrix sp. TS-e1954]